MLRNEVLVDQAVAVTISPSTEAQDELHKAPAASCDVDLSTLPTYSLYPLDYNIPIVCRPLERVHPLMRLPRQYLYRHLCGLGFE